MLNSKQLRQEFLKATATEMELRWGDVGGLPLHMSRGSWGTTPGREGAVLPRGWQKQLRLEGPSGDHSLNQD